MEILFILQIINIPKNDPYDWFCAPGSHILICCPRNMSDYYKYCIFFAETHNTFANEDILKNANTADFHYVHEGRKSYRFGMTLG